MNTQYLKYAAVGVAGFFLGGGVTYILTKKRIRKHEIERADEEIKSVKDTYKLLRKEPPYDDPKTAVKAYLDRIDDLQYAAQAATLAAEEQAEERVKEATENLEEAIDEVEEVHEVVEEKLEDIRHGRLDEIDTIDEIDQAIAPENNPIVRNVFEEANRRLREGVRPIDITQVRGRNAPYLITTDEFMEDDDDKNYAKITIAYFEGDDTLCDERESLIPDVEGTVGRANLSKFGEGSDSPDTIYVRNERLETDFEVNRENGSYSHIVLGAMEYRDPSPKIRKMRDDE